MLLSDAFYHQFSDLCFHFTDTAGGSKDIFEREDPEAHFSIHIRSGHRGVTRIFNLFGRMKAIPYLVQEAARLHEEDRIRRPKRERRKLLIVANTAPRSRQGFNGVEFYMGRVGEDTQVIGSPRAFSLVRGKLRDGFYCLPNDNAYIFPVGDQFRSSYVEEVGSDPSALTKADPSIIPDPPSSPTLAYVDYFGNMKVLTPDDDAFWKALTQCSKECKGDRVVGLEIAGRRLDVILCRSLGDARPGASVIYRDASREGRVNLAWVWLRGLSAAEKQSRSIYAKFGKPHEGAFVSVLEPLEGCAPERLFERLSKQVVKKVL